MCIPFVSFGPWLKRERDDDGAVGKKKRFTRPTVPWLDLLVPDTRDVIRHKLDILSACMLAMTCRAEYRLRKHPADAATLCIHAAYRLTEQPLLIDFLICELGWTRWMDEENRLLDAWDSEQEEAEKAGWLEHCYLVECYANEY